MLGKHPDSKDSSTITAWYGILELKMRRYGLHYFFNNKLPSNPTIIHKKDYEFLQCEIIPGFN